MIEFIKAKDNIRFIEKATSLKMRLGSTSKT